MPLKLVTTFKLAAIFSDDEDSVAEMKLDGDSDYDMDIDNYQPIQDIGNDHGVFLITPKISKVHLNDLQVRQLA